MGAVYMPTCKLFVMVRQFSNTVMKLLELSKPYYADGRWRRPTISAKELREMGKVMVLDGEKWPTKLLQDRGIDTEPQFKREKKREERFLCILLHPTSAVLFSFEGKRQSKKT